MNKRRDSLTIGIGLTTFMMVFIVLCLTIFATLAYLQAKHNEVETNKIIDASVAYYDADYEASKLYVELRSHLEDTSFLQENNITKKENVYSYSVSISSTQSLYVSLESIEDDLVIKEWKAIATPSDNDYGHVGLND